jgi:hypothetical protein
MKIHTPSLAVGAALMVGVSLLSAQNIVGTPSVEVRVLQAPALRMLGPEQVSLEAPFLNGSVQYVVQPGEVVDLSRVILQHAGDISQVDKYFNINYSINGGSTAGGYQAHAGWPLARDIGFDNYLCVPGDVLEFVRTPYAGQEASSNFPATIVLQVER